MHHFLNGISLLFNPFETQELYFKNQAQHESYWLTALAYLSQAYHVEQEKRTTQSQKQKRTSVKTRLFLSRTNTHSRNACTL